MKMTRVIACTLLALGISRAETPPEPPAKYFHLTFVVKEVDDGKTINSRSYSTFVSSLRRDSGSSIRTGAKVRERQSNDYVDVGIDLDSRFSGEVGNSLALHISADIASIVQGVGDTGPASLDVIRHNRWNSEVIIPIAKPTTIYSSDDLTSKRKTQIELTATAVAP